MRTEEAPRWKWGKEGDGGRKEEKRKKEKERG